MNRINKIKKLTSKGRDMISEHHDIQKKYFLNPYKSQFDKIPLQNKNLAKEFAKFARIFSSSGLLIRVEKWCKTCDDDEKKEIKKLLKQEIGNIKNCLSSFSNNSKKEYEIIFESAPFIIEEYSSAKKTVHKLRDILTKIHELL